MQKIVNVSILIGVIPAIIHRAAVDMLLYVFTMFSSVNRWIELQILRPCAFILGNQISNAHAICLATTALYNIFRMVGLIPLLKDLNFRNPMEKLIIFELTFCKWSRKFNFESNRRHRYDILLIILVLSPLNLKTGYLLCKQIFNKQHNLCFLLWNSKFQIWANFVE